MSLNISDDLELPLNAVTQKFAFLGRTGSGKSYGATKLCELMLDAKAQVIALDPVGVWWGLRTGARRGRGYDIPVFGGLHGDLPLEPGSGTLVADLIVDRAISAVIDVSQFLQSQQARFATDFVTQLFQRKKAAPSPVHIFVEEAQEFVPQNVSSGETQLVHAFERLIKLGRNFGIGASLISQRPQEVNKKALNQTECLFAFQMTGPQERKAIESWVSEKGADEDIVATLPKLKVGEPHVWSPQWLQVSKTIRIARKHTADVSSTPALGDEGARVARALAPVDVEKLREQMAATIERAKAEDPRELRKEIAELQKQLKHAQSIVKVEKTEAREVPVLKDGQLARIEKWIERVAKVYEQAEKALVPINLAGVTAIGTVREALSKLHPDGANSHRLDANMQKNLHICITPAASFSRPQMAAAARPATPPRARETAGGERASAGEPLPEGERKVLIAIAQYDGAARDQITILTGFKRSTRDAYIQRLKSRRLIEDAGARSVRASAHLFD